MAKAKNVVENNAEESEINELDKIEEPIKELTEEKITDNVIEEPMIYKKIYVPDIPAQMIEEKESDEVVFLRYILKIQHEGGFGRHLDDLINDKIKTLKNVK